MRQSVAIQTKFLIKQSNLNLRTSNYNNDASSISNLNKINNECTDVRDYHSWKTVQKHKKNKVVNNKKPISRTQKIEANRAFKVSNRTLDIFFGRVSKKFEESDVTLYI